MARPTENTPGCPQVSPDKKSAKKRYEEDNKVRAKEEEFRNMILHNKTDILGDPNCIL